MTTAIAAVDVGSLRSNNFGWYLFAPDGESDGQRPETLLDALNAQLDTGGAVTLGFECPLWFPIPQSADVLGRARPGEGNRAWTASAGTAALATGVQQMTWVFTQLADLHADTLTPTLSYDDLTAGTSRLMIWEAFVSGSGKPEPSDIDPHIADARLAVNEFAKRADTAHIRSDCPPDSDVFSLTGAALLRSGLSTESSLLSQAPLVVKV